MNELSVIRIPIEGEWRAYEWIELFSFIDEMYSDLALIHIANEIRAHIDQREDRQEIGSNRISELLHIIKNPELSSTQYLEWYPFEMEQYWEIPLPDVLRVVEIKYGSDGNGDFWGLGKITKALSNIINNIIDCYKEKEEREEKRLENIKKELKLIDKYGILSDEDRNEYAILLLAGKKRKARKFIESNRIKKTKTLPPPKKWEKDIPALPPPS